MIRIRHPEILALLAASLLARAAPALTITEIHYAPPAAEGNLAFVEVFNDASSPVDLSGWSFSRGIQFVFPEGTLLPGRAYAVVAADRAALASRYGLAGALGDFSGALDPRGETLAISDDSGMERFQVSYRDRGKWPSAPRGTGFTLSIRGPDLDPDDGVSWSWSAERGGTPGRENFPRPAGGIIETEVIRRGAIWRYRRGTAPFSSPAAAWRAPGFDDASWASGATGIGYGDADDATVLGDMQAIAATGQAGYASIACRERFPLSAAEISAAETVVLALDYDDGFIASLNGVEFARAGLGSPGDLVAFDALADDHEAGTEEEFTIPKSLLAAGDNLLAVEVHNTALTSSDLSFIPRLLLRHRAAAAETARVLLNELHSRAAGERWLELYNPGVAAVDLAGFRLSDDAARADKFLFPATASIASRGFLVLTETDLGLALGLPEVSLFLSAPGGDRILDARIFDVAGPPILAGVSDARFPDGAANWVRARAPTRGGPNRLDVERNLILNEILYRPFESRDSAGAPFTAPPGEFLELYNRGADPIPLDGFAFTKGVDFAFPPGARLEAGRYLVVAQDPVYLESAYGIAGVLGPWTGNLSNNGETIRLEDPYGNAVDEVTYHDSGDWSPLADGGGSSLELVDPRQDNSAGSAWEASDESGKAPWVELVYSGHYAALDGNVDPGLFRFTPMQEGSFLLDDVRILRGAVNHVANSGFESGTDGWVMEGTLVHSRRSTAEAHSGSACLEVVATDRGDLRVNRLAVIPSPSMPAGDYTVRFWARWRSGGNLILAHGFDNDLARTLWLPVPRNCGTPGSENSAAARLRARSGSSDLGPVFRDASQEPALPAPGQETTVAVTITAADGVASARLLHRSGGRGDGIFESVDLLPVDPDAGDGRYRANVPGRDAGTKVLYYFEAEDGAGTVRRYPIEAPERTLLFQAGQPASGPLSGYRLVLDDDRQGELETRSIQSDDPLEGSFVFDDAEIYQGVSLHYHGSPWERPGNPRSFRLTFPGDRPFHGSGGFNISRYGSAMNEAAAYYTIGRNGRPGAPAPHGDYQFVRWSLSGDDQGIMGRVETVDGSYLKRWFHGDSDGPHFRANAKITFRLDESWNLARWAALEYLGADKESYRWNWDLHTRELEDDWGPFISLMKLLDPDATPAGADFESKVKALLDVGMLARVLAVRVLNDDWDTIGLVNGQNAYLYYAPIEGRWKYIPWDMDGTFNNISAPLSPLGDPGIARLFARPEFRRLLLQSMLRSLGRTWSEAGLRRLLDPLDSAGVGNEGGVIGFVNGRRPAALAAVHSTATFRILTNGGKDFAVATDTTALKGEAPLEVETILLGGEPLAGVAWTGVAAWSATVPLLPGENRLELFGLDADGAILSSAAITVTSTLAWNPPAITAVEPASGPETGGSLVTIRGSDFHPGIKIAFGAAAASGIELVSSAELRAVTPPGAGKVAVKGTNLDGRSANLAAGFTYLAPQFLRGDADGDGVVTVTDTIAALNSLFRGGSLICAKAADANDDGRLDLGDAIRILFYLFASGPPPAPPFPEAGNDPTPDNLGCG